MANSPKNSRSESRVLGAVNRLRFVSMGMATGLSVLISLLAKSQTVWTPPDGDTSYRVSIPHDLQNGYESCSTGAPHTVPVTMNGETVIMFYYASSIWNQKHENEDFIMARGSKDNGKTWTLGPKMVFAASTNLADWDCKGIDTPCVIYNSTIQKYMLFYYGHTSVVTDVGACLGIATSSSPFGPFIRRTPNLPILKPHQGKWDSLWIESPSVVKLDGVYYMAYAGLDDRWIPRLGMAYSKNGFDWTPYEENPILSPGLPCREGSSNDWDCLGISCPTLVYINQNLGWGLYYSGATKRSRQGRVLEAVGLATTPNLTCPHAPKWKKYNQRAPLIEFYACQVPMHPLAGGPNAPDVRWDGEKWVMWVETGSGFVKAVSQK